MSAPFRVLTTSHFDQEARNLLSSNPTLVQALVQLKAILQDDPYNRTQQYSIRKLKGVAAGQGLWRIRSGKYRLRYDITRY
jgi:mRNA-degrading endonuclease RelE of RelBE toxin-antitoxin system